MLTVEKIGGTSMSDFSSVIKNIITHNRSGNELYNRIFVVSAYADVTNWLLENKKTNAPGIYQFFVKQQDFTQPLKDLKNNLKNINKKYVDLGLDLEVADSFIEKRIDDAEKYLKSLAEVLSSGYVKQENIFQAAREILASIGESHSAFNSANILVNKKINTALIDLSGFHDSQMLNIDERIKINLKDVDFSNNLVFITGYTKGVEGIMREFDRGYSEITFSKVAVAVNADEAIIYKEYHLSSADPKIVGIENCVPIGFTNFDVADQLADVGMEAIHPKAAKPLEINNINLRIKNTFEPDHPGTLITKEYTSIEKKVEVITGSDKVLIIDIYDPLMIGYVGYDLKIMQDFLDFNISYICKATSANSISLVIWEKDFKEELLKILEIKYQAVILKKVAIVCLIGTHIDQPGVLNKITASLSSKNINILAISHSLRQVNIQIVIERERFVEAIKILNENIK